jgi:hypothetical protein
MPNIKYLILSLFITGYAFGQPGDRIKPLHTNPVLTAHCKQAKKLHKFDKITPPPGNPVKTISLPFLDDFSKPGPFPDPNLWQNNNVFVNYTYPMAAHTLGVATFDGVNGYGAPYDSACPLGAAYPADTLTSQLIKMGNYNLIGDSVYFSFYYQPGGYGALEQPISVGDFPNPNDTLILEFFNGQQWNEVWYHLGYNPAYNDTEFHYVLIKVQDSQYFINGFQFRFRNYANTSGNFDHWNIDEVYMNVNRRLKDTFQYDVAFEYQAPSLLNNYRAMPWEQFTAADMKTSFGVMLRNNDSLCILANSINTNYFYDTIPNFINGYTSGVDNVQTYVCTGPCNDPAISTPPVNANYHPLSGNTTYNFTQYIHPSPDFDAWNDTLRSQQVFSDYYAYDDGTAEVAYSVIPVTGNTAYMAEQFTLNTKDTIVGVYIFFTYDIVNASKNSTFHLALWNDNGGSPGTMIHEEDTLYSPKYGDSLDQFVYYPFHFASGQPDSVISGTFYVGWQQIDGDSINIGADWNDNNQYKIFYNLTPNDAEAGWNYCSYPISIMMRPVFAGSNFNTIFAGTQNITEPKPITIYPNPAKDEVSFSPNLQANTSIKVFAADGRMILENDHFTGSHLSTANLPDGFYIVELKPENGQPQFQKLLISR